MRGIVLAGGTGSRLWPLTKVTNKHLLPVGRHPMIYYPVHALLDAGIEDILIVTGVEHAGEVVTLLGSGKSLGVHFSYCVQDRPGGIADALGLARDFSRGDRSLVILGDNVFTQSLGPFAKAFLRQDRGARILLHRVRDPGRFGVPVFEGPEIVRIDEKPERPQSEFCVTGVYMYDADVFDVIAGLHPSARGELEITDVNNHYIAQGSMRWDVLTGPWTDAGTFESLQAANRFAGDRALPRFTAR